MSTPTLVPLQSEIPPARAIILTRRLSDRVFRGVVTAGGFVSLIVLGLIALFLASRSVDIFKTFGFGFITEFKWDSGDPDNGIPPVLGIGAMLIGTIVTAVVGLVIALPVSVGMALFL